MPSPDVIVRDPVVITAGLPRFLAPGDAAVMRLDVANTDGPAGDYALSIDTTGDLSTGDKPLPREADARPGQAPDADRAADRADAPATPRSPSSSPTPTAPTVEQTLLRAGAPGATAGHHAPCGRPQGQWRQPARRQGAAGGKPARRRLGQRRRFAGGGLRRAVAADDARPLPLWLRRADDQPRHAAALCQRAGSKASAWRAIPTCTAASRTPSTRC